MRYLFILPLFLISFFTNAKESYLNTWGWWNSDTIQTGYQAPDKKSLILLQYIYDSEQPSFAFNEVFLSNQQIGDCSLHDINSPKLTTIKINGITLDFIGVCTPPTPQNNITQWFYTTTQETSNKTIYDELINNKKIEINTPYFIATLTNKNFKKTYTELQSKHNQNSKKTVEPPVEKPAENHLIITCKVNVNDNSSDLNYSILLDSGTINGYKAEITDSIFRFNDGKFTHVINRYTGGMNLISSANHYMFSGSCKQIEKTKF